jgi:filamentous hemagglutinin family protein
MNPSALHGRFLTTAVVGAVALGAALPGSHAVAGGQLPVPCLVGNCSGNPTPGFTTAPGGFVTSGQARATQSGNTLTVTQSTNQAILNWASFNIGADGKVVFVQPSSTAIALNKIYQQSPSSIFGELTANGQVYLINPNGFVFGSNATVNVAGLMASSLGLYGGDAEFNSGLLSQIAQYPPLPALASDGRQYVTDSSGNPVLDGNGNVQPVQVLVQPGAQITAADGGRLLLAGQDVINGGTLTAPDGQVILAAGQSAYLAASSDPSLRGLIVAVTGNGTVTNQAGGVISAPRGNVSLIGYAVNQNGRLSATTAVSANGSVVLTAADGSGLGCQTGELLCSTQGGTLSIGASSQIDILPDASQGTAVAAQPQVQSSITLLGQQVDIAGGQITAPGGTLKVVAAADPDVGIQTEGNSAAQIRIASGTGIDLAGSVAELPMSANLLSIQLRANELEDDPQQRAGALHGQTVIVDMRDGRPELISDASWQSALQGVQENIEQRTSAGGSANFSSEGDIVVSSGATINVSGGQWNYAGGVVQTSELVASNGRSYNIVTANPSLTYTGVLNPTFTQTYNGFGVQITQPTPGLSTYESGYTQGFSAGTVSFAAPAMALQGTLLGSAVNGPYQRGAAKIPAESFAALAANNGVFPSSGAAAMATGGTLIIGDPSAAANSAGLPYFFAPTVEFTPGPTPVSIPDGTPLPVVPLQLSTAYISSGGFANTQIYSDGSVTLPQGLPLDLGAGGSLQIVAPRISIGSDIQALGGSITLLNALSAVYQSASEPRLGIDVASGVTLNVSGQWTNDSPEAAPVSLGATYQNGGSITLSLSSAYSPTTAGGELVLGDNVSLLANGGAWVQANNSVTGGVGGRITLDAAPYQSALQVGNADTLQGFGVQGAAGGTFTLNAPSLEVATGNGSWAAAQRIDTLTDPGVPFVVGAPLFSSDGFSTVNLTATAPVTPGAASNDVLTVATGTVIDAQSQSLQLLAGYQMHATGGSIQRLAVAQMLPEAQSTPFTVTLAVTPAAVTDPSTTVIGDLDVQQGAQIVAAPNSTINLIGEGSVLIGGRLSAPAGTVNVQIASPDTNDQGFLASQRIELGPQAVIDVSGTLVPQINSLGLPLGTVLSGGSVNLIANRGEVITDAGSLINVAGSSASLDELQTKGSGGYQRTTVGSAGGALLVGSVESVSLLGNLSAGAGQNASGALEAGSLTLELSNSFLTSEPPGSATPFPAAPYQITLVSSTAGAAASASNQNQAILGIAQLEQSGIGVFRLQADNSIALASNQPLALSQEISLDAPVISVGAGVQASLSAPYVLLKDSQQLSSLQPSSAGTGSLAISGQQIVLAGNTSLQGVQSATLNSSGDVQFEPIAADQLSGTLNLTGSLTVDAARVYPATNTQYTINDAGGSVTFGQTSASPGMPLSAAGSLTVNAADISSSGTLVAPFGQIALNASDSLALLSGSVTSVSAAGSLVPYGQTTLDQQEWLYAAGNTTTAVTGVPARQITLSAPQVTLASGATINVSGGGDLQAYEWVPGTGGSVDALSQSNAAAAGYYAILPSTAGQYAAYDQQEFTGSAVGAGASVDLSGVAGLAAGVYPLLPARDALLPGAMLIQVQSNYQSTTPGVLGTLSNGGEVVAGYLTFGNTGLRATSEYTGFAIYPQNYAQSLADYSISDASRFFATAATNAGQSAANLPANAGSLLIGVGSSLNALATVDGAGATGGLGATVDLYTTGEDSLTVVANTQSSGGTGVTIAAPVLTSWNAGNLVLGGVLSSDGNSIDVTASSVTFASGAQLVAGQVLAVADQSIDVQAGANVSSSSGASGKALTALPGSLNLTVSGAGASGAALLAVSDLATPIALRPAAVASAAGTITIEDGATLNTRGAVALDAPGGVAVAGSINAPGASWSLASDSIAFVGSGTSTDTLQINSALQSDLQSAGAVRLSSAGAIDLLTPVRLGIGQSATSPSLSSLTLSAVSINNLAGGSSEFGGQFLVLHGTGTTAVPANAGGGTLEFLGNTVEFGGAGNLALNGNSATSVQASLEVIGVGSGTLAIGGNATIAAPEMTASSGAVAALRSSGTLQIQQLGTAAAPSALTASLGGNLTISAADIQDSGSIVVPGGQIALQAASGLAVNAGAVIDAGGISVTAVGESIGAAGGFVNLSAGGSLALTSGSTVSVAGAGQSPAGFVTISGGGTVTLAGTLSGSAASGATGGSFTLQAGQLAGGLPALVPVLSQGGFTEQIAVRVQNGDLDSVAGSTLTANRITLTADSGSIDIAGTLSAPGAGLRGSIGLFAGSNLTLESTGVLQANGSGSAGVGGDVELSSVSGSLNLISGSLVSASGQAQMGNLLLRAPALVGTGDVAITAIGSNVSGVGQITIEPVLAPIQSNADFTANFTPIQNEVGSYLGQVNANGGLPARLQLSGGPTEVLEPGVIVQASSNLTLSQALDLNALQLGAPIDLTVQATGSIAINGQISDGIEGATLLSTPSSSLRFVAGADLSSANPLATLLSSAGRAGPSLSLGAGASVVTGTGTIDLVAAGDVQFGAGATAFATGLLAGANTNVRLGNGQIGTMSFANDGGNVLISAGGDVLGTPLVEGVSTWQLRTVKSGLGEYGINVLAFGADPWSVATFGGGDLSIQAAGSIVNVSAAVADSELLINGVQSHIASGGMTLDAGANITTGQFFVANGTGTFNAGGAIDSNLSRSVGGAATRAVGSVFNLGDAQLSLWAEGAIRVDGILNPTAMSQPEITAGAGQAQGFFTYGPNSSFSAQSSAGDVTLNDQLASLSLLVGPAAASSSLPGLSFYPATLRLLALNANLELGGTDFSTILYPSATGQLQLFAGQDIEGGGHLIAMSDAAATLVPTVASAQAQGLTEIDRLSNSNVLSNLFFGNWHVGDATPASIVAGRDIDDLALSVPKASDIEAGRDIVNLQYSGQNLTPTDLTLIYAGRNFMDPQTYGDNGVVIVSPGTVQVGGPGQLDILAGGQINLGFSQGAATVGTDLNANLGSAAGASITMMAGLAQSPDYSAFYQQIIAPSASYQQQLVSYVESTTGLSNLSTAQADAAFSALGQNAQLPFIDQVFFNELNQSGLEANQTPALGYTRGYTAISALFPGSPTGSASNATNPYNGDLDLTYSRIYTLSGGDISLLVPGGSINVGLANPPASLVGSPKSASELGIVAQGAGNVDVYSEGDVNVNSSRIFTLGGGNILVWSEEGNIDAGNGAKSSLSLPPPTYLVDSQGNVQLVFNAAVAGSGIRTIQTSPSEPAGNVDLIAPVGSVNAGDAGIGAAGDINIAAVTVTGAGNINFGGSAAGVPSVVSNLSASLSSASATASSASTSAGASMEEGSNGAQSAPLAQAALSWLDVFVTGLGEENCKPDDLACLKRQQHQ